MSEQRITIDDKEVKEAIKKMADPETLLDPAFRETFQNSLYRLGATTPRRTGTTARNWKPKMKGLCAYEISNDTMTDDHKHLIVDILNDGRGEVFPVKAKALFIPLTPKGDAGYGDYGLDWVLAKSAKAFAGTQFLAKELEVATKELLDKIKKILKDVK